MDSVAVTGLPDGFKGFAGAEVRVPGDTLVGFTWLAEDSVTGAWSLVVPLHPSGTLEGGPVEVRIGNADGACPAQPFTIAALPEAPGTVAAVADVLEDAVAARAAQFGATPDDLLRVNPERTFPPLLALAVAQAAVDHPDNPNSLRRTLAGDAPRLDRQKPDLRVLDALWAKAGLVTKMEALTREIERLPRFSPALIDAFERMADPAADPSPVGVHDALPRTTGPFRTASFASPSPVSQQRKAICPGPASFYKPDAATLSQYMKASLEGEIASTGKAKDIFSALQLTLATGAALPVPVYRQIMTAGGATSVAYIFSQEAAAGVLPRTFKSMDVTLSKPYFLEDENVTGRWSNLQVTTISTGWTVSEKIMEQITNMGLGQASEVASWGTTLWKGTDELYRTLAKTIMDQAMNDAESAPMAADAVLGDTQINWGPCEFGPTDISDERWSEVRLTGGPAIALADGDRTTYAPQQAGTSTLVFSTKTGSHGNGELGTFGVASIQTTETVEVRAIEVKVTPPRMRVKPGESVTFRAEVTNALDPRLEWTVTPAKHTIITAGPNKHVVDVTTSKNADDFAAVLKGTSVADRSHLVAAPDRFGSAVIQGSELVLIPANACVRPGDTQTFTVQTPDVEVGGITLPGGADASGGTDFNWTASAGSINNQGVFTPPGGDGEATITATSKEDPTIMGDVTVRYGEQCQSQFAFTTGGAVALNESGPIERFMGLQHPQGCFVGIYLQGASSSGTSTEQPPSLSIVAMLPDGLRSGTFTIGPNYLPPSEPSGSFSIPADVIDIPAASPGTYFSELDIGKRSDVDGFPDTFSSHDGTITIKRDEDTVSMSFTFTLLEFAPERSGPRGVLQSRRQATVQGRLTHVLRTGSRYIGSKDYYTCKPPAQ